MVYLARTADGVVAIDLGWWGHGRSLGDAFRQLHATPADVSWVFLTHSHRDHIAAWREVRQARFVLAAAELPRLFGLAPHRGWIARWGDRLWPADLPRPGDLTTLVFTTDTTFTLGTDTLYAFIVPGHTPGSTVYLFRGVLFLGDAMTYSRSHGLAPAKRGFSDDPGVAATNLATLWSRLPRSAVRYVCTAHARCAPFPGT